MNAKAIKKVLPFILILIFCFAPYRGAFALDERLIAHDWNLNADETAGLVAVPKDPAAAGDNLFDVSRMTPGDTVSSTVTVRNRCSFSIMLSVEVRFIGGDLELANWFDFHAYRDGAVVASFPMTINQSHSFAAAFDPGVGNDTDLRFEVRFPVHPSGDTNYYQDKSAEFQWIFTAERVPGPDPSPSPDPDPGVVVIVPPEIDSDEDFDDPDVPRDYFEDDDDTEEIIDDIDVPLDEFEMPRTGEHSLWITTLLGSALIILGAALLKKERSERRKPDA